MPWDRHQGGYPARSSWGGGTLPGPARGRGGTLPGPAGGGTLPGPARGSTLLGGYPTRGYPAGGYPGRVPPVLTWPGGEGGYPGRVPPWQGPPRQGTTPPDLAGGGGYPVWKTEGVVTTRRAVCLLRSRRRTFLLHKTHHLRKSQINDHDHRCVRLKKAVEELSLDNKEGLWNSKTFRKPKVTC